MLAESKRDSTRPWGTLAAVIAVLVLSNVVSNRIVPSGWYVPWNLAAAGVLVLLAVRSGGCTRADLGLAGRDARAGLRWGLVLAGVIVGVYAVTVAVSSDVFRDERVLGSSGLELAYQAVVRIPLGTVVLEELAFRGVLVAVLARIAGPGRAVLISAGLFGLWHILPALGLSDVNPVVERGVGGSGAQVATVVGAVLATAVAGVVLGGVRLRSRSLLAPALVHLTTNSVGYVIAWVVLRAG